MNVQNGAPARKVKLFLRLAAGVNENLRCRLRYRGDFSRLIEEALCKTDLSSTPLVAGLALGKSKGTTAAVDTGTSKALRAAAAQRRCSANSLANSAIAAWLQRQ